MTISLESLGKNSTHSVAITLTELPSKLHRLLRPSQSRAARRLKPNIPLLPGFRFLRGLQGALPRALAQFSFSLLHQ